MSNIKLYNKYEIMYDPTGAYILIELTQKKYGKCNIEDWLGKTDHIKWLAHHERGRWYMKGYDINDHKMKYFHKLITGFKETDHRDRDGLNNLRNNLRECSRTENNMNKIIGKNSKTKEKNIMKMKLPNNIFKYEVRISKNGKRIIRKQFLDFKEAVEYRNKVKFLPEIHGIFGRN